MPAVKQILNQAWKRVSYLINYQVLPSATLNLPDDMAFGVTRIMKDVEPEIEDALDTLYTKLTHINYMWGFMDGVSSDRRWRAYRTQEQDLTQPINTSLSNGQTWSHTFDFSLGPNKVVGQVYLVDWNNNGLGFSTDNDGGNVRVHVQNNTGSTQNINASVKVKIVTRPGKMIDDMNMSPKHILITQAIEDGSTTAQSQEILQLGYNKLVAQNGVTSPEQTNVGDDYFSPIYGFSVGAAFRFMTEAKRRPQLSSVTEARKMYSPLTEDRPVGEYYSSHRAYRNGFSNEGYMDSYQRSGQGLYLFKQIFEREKFHIAEPNRKLVQMSWAETEGVESKITAAGTGYRLKFPQGDIIRYQKIGFPAEMMKCQTFFHLLQSKVITLWHSPILMLKELETWTDYSIANGTRFDPAGGGPTVEWDPNNPAHPQSVRPPGTDGQFPECPQIGENGAWLGAKLIEMITTLSNRTSNSIAYSKYNFRVNGGAVQPGYAPGRDTPTYGLLGNAELNRFGVSNPGSDSIVDIEKNKKIIALTMKGGDGNAVAIKPMFQSPTDVIEVVVDIAGVNHTITHKGNKLEVYLINSGMA